MIIELIVALVVGLYFGGFIAMYFYAGPLIMENDLYDQYPSTQWNDPRIKDAYRKYMSDWKLRSVIALSWVSCMLERDLLLRD